MPATPRILVIRRRYLGDIVLLGSVLQNLRLQWPQAHITLLAEQAFAPIALLHGEINRVRAFPRKLGEWPGFCRDIRREAFTHVLDFDNTDKTALVTRLSGAPLRVTYDRETNPFRHRWVYTGQARITNEFYTSQHITETYLKLLEPAGVPVVSRAIKLTPREPDLAAVAKFGGGFKRKVLVHPGSRSRFRVWPAERFAAVCDRMQDELDVQVFIAAGPGERAMAQQIRQLAQRHVVVLDQRFTICEFAALISKFNLLLCHDSGPMHIAAAVGVPVVALFGSQNTYIWRPIGEGHTILHPPLPCTCLPDTPTPCVKMDSYRNYCVRKLGVDEVFAALQRKLVIQN
ncbi:MAG: glycosyltransferase family 9 protein [Cephaloticoccus sp.]|nr:glycosyltransferase family 9 protein [Cephaloticoccus sp.]